MNVKQIRSSARAHAKVLVGNLFRNGHGEKAERLKLVRKNRAGGEMDLGGRCRSNVEDLVADEIGSAIYFALYNEEKHGKRARARREREDGNG